MPARERERNTKAVRSPELERLVRALEMVATDLPRILRKEKEVAFDTLERVDQFEAHMKEMRAIPAHLEALTRVVDRSLQVQGAAAHLSRTFQAINNMRPVDASETTIVPEKIAPEVIRAPAPVLETSPLTGAASDEAPGSITTDPTTGDLVKEEVRPARFYPKDLNLEQVRDAIVPGGEISGRSMFQSSKARLVTARASGDGPWRFQFRSGSLAWAAEAETKGLRGVAVMICGDLGYVEVPARLLLERARDHLMTSSGGNTVVRPSLAVYGREAILHPGAMSASRPGEPVKLAFVEF